jgi:hypothetical protein
MHDPRVVRRLQPIGDLYGPLQQFIGLQGLSPDAVFQRVPFQKLHGDKRLSLVLARLVDHADVRMIQSRGGARFPLHSLQRFHRAGQTAGEKLERYGARQHQILRQPHFAHAARADGPDQTIVPQHLADLWPLLSDPSAYGDRLQCRHFQKTVQLRFVTQQRFDCLAQLRVAAAALAQEFVSLGRAQFQRAAVQFFQPAFAFIIGHALFRRSSRGAPWPFLPC